MDSSFWLIEKVFPEHLPGLCSTGGTGGERQCSLWAFRREGQKHSPPTKSAGGAGCKDGVSKYRWESREGPTALPDGCGNGVSDGYGKTQWPGPNSGVWQS